MTILKKKTKKTANCCAKKKNEVRAGEPVVQQNMRGRPYVIYVLYVLYVQ